MPLDTDVTSYKMHSQLLAQWPSLLSRNVSLFAFALFFFFKAITFIHKVHRNLTPKHFSNRKVSILVDIFKFQWALLILSAFKVKSQSQLLQKGQLFVTSKRTKGEEKPERVSHFSKLLLRNCKPANRNECTEQIIWSSSLFDAIRSLSLFSQFFVRSIVFFGVCV